jgi:2-iminobutanoate/2-iminopropanoate deaminase
MKLAVGGPKPGGGYSPGIVAEGRFLFVAGQGPLRDGIYVPGSIEEEVRLTLENVETVLKDAACGFADVVQCRVYLANPSEFRAMDSAYSAFIPDPKPARTTIGANLIIGRVEIDCIALVPGSEDREPH